jgi:hypothetical protein
MKKLIVAFLITLIANISSAQSGWGYVNYTSYKTHNGTGVTNQYQAHPNSAAEFDILLNTSNSNTTITHTGEVTLATMCDGSTGTPHWGSDFYAIKFEFWFIPTQTGSYSFGVNSDDASDLSVDGTVITTYYGGHGAGGYQYGSKNMVAGTRYKIVARYEEYGGGDALFVRWSRPSAPNTYSYWNEEVTNINTTPTKKAVANFNLNTNLTATTFAVGSALSSAGLIDITTSLDSVKVSSGDYKASTTNGGVEWCVIYQYDATNQRYRIGIDSREVNGILSTPSSISSLQLFDLWDGPVTFNSYDPNGWTEVYIYTPTQFNFLGSSFSSNIRAGNGFYGLQAEFTFSQLSTYKPQSISLTTTNNLSTLYNSIVTVSDVYLAFKELANGGIFGNQSGNEFGYGIQYKNADVNDDGYFNEADCFRLLQNLTGAKTLVDTFNLNKTMRIIPQTKYDSIGKSNWTAFTTPLGSGYSFDINTGKSIDTLNLTVSWKGDVNLSHSTTPVSNGITTSSVRSMSVVSNEVQASIITEMSTDKVYAYISFNPLQQEVVGTQFQLKYDNSMLKFEKAEFTTKGSPTNYGTNKGDYINVGSLISDGSTSLDNTTEYKITFTPISSITNALGLISIGGTDAVNKSGKQLKVKIN